MKFKRGWEKLPDEKMPDHVRANVLRATRVEMADAKDAGAWWRRLWLPALAGSLALGAVAIVLVNRAQPPLETALADDPEMIREAAMLYDLDLLRKLAETQKRWDKKKI